MSLDAIETAARAALDGRTGVLVRFGIASTGYVVLAALWRRTLSAEAAVWAQVVSSTAFLALLATPWVTAVLVLHAALLFAVIEWLPPSRARSLLIGGLVAALAVLPVVWFPFFPGYGSKVREFVTFGTSAALLRAWAWVRDRPRLRGQGVSLARDYALYTFFLPSYVNGPFFSPTDLERRQLPSYWKPAAEMEAPNHAQAVRRILTGIAAALAATVLIDVFTSQAYRGAAAGSTLSAWRHAFTVYVCFYLGFTAWTEASIGFGLLAGLRLPENFDHPHLAYGLADFWRRWNVTLGRWMLQYVYLPLAPRGRPTRGFAWYGTAAVFSSVAVYHFVGGLKLFGVAPARLPGFWIPWIAWAALNTIGVRLTQSLRPPERTSARDMAVAAATIGVAALGMMIVFFPLDLPLPLLRTTVERMLIPHGAAGGAFAP